MFTAIARSIVHLITRERQFYYKRLAEIAPSVKGQRVLEIGSGKQVKGQEAYSAIHIFKDVAEFRQTDINPEFGHEILDITAMDIQSEYGLILCLNVLEHVYDFQTAVKNLHAAVAEGGRLIVAVPFAYPLHDEPHDYYRYTEHALRRMLGDFKSVTVENKGIRQMSYGYFVVAEK